MSNQRLIFGFHAINARLWQNARSLIEIYVEKERSDARMRDVLAKAAAENIRVILTDKERLDRLSHHARHQGVVAFIDASFQTALSLDDVLDAKQEAPFLLVLDGVTDPHNLGAILRTAEALGVDAVIAPKDKSAGINATVSKVACGAAEVIPYVTVTNLARTLRDLKKRGIWIIGTQMDAAEDLYHADIPSAVAWVLGSEGQGMRRLTVELCDKLVRIPMFGTVESLNVSVSAAMVLSETRRRRWQKD